MTYVSEPQRWGRGRKKTVEDWSKDRRVREIVHLRARGLTYAKIGRRVGITGERVRQVLNASGNDWATGWKINGIPDAVCPGCGESFHPSARHQRLCSRGCRSAYHARTLTKRQRVALSIITSRREAGKTWHEVSLALGWRYTGGIVTYFRRLCSKAGIDPAPHLSGRRGRGIRARIFYERTQVGG